MEEWTKIKSTFMIKTAFKAADASKTNSVMQ